jgi:hypothetical protein
MPQASARHHCVALVLDETAEQHAVRKQAACILDRGAALP